MAPEQAKGKAVDKRADVWAFGVVLYEMLTGRRLFDAEDISETLAAVLRQEITLSALPATTPPRLTRLIGRCLERDPKQRLRDIGEARIEIARIEAGGADVMEAPAAAAATPPPASGRAGVAYCRGRCRASPARRSSQRSSSGRPGGSRRHPRCSRSPWTSAPTRRSTRTRARRRSFRRTARRWRSSRRRVVSRRSTFVASTNCRRCRSKERTGPRAPSSRQTASNWASSPTRSSRRCQSWEAQPPTCRMRPLVVAAGGLTTTPSSSRKTRAARSA